MMNYELYLPILKKYKGKALVRKLCRTKDPFKPGEPRFWFSRTYHVERVWHDGKRYIQQYGGFHCIAEAEALKADKIEVNQYAGTSELTVDLIYEKDNPLTHKFIREFLHQEPLKEAL